MAPHDEVYEEHRRDFIKLTVGGAAAISGLAGCTGGGDGGGDGDSDGDGDTATGTPVQGETASERALNAAAGLAEDAPKDNLEIFVPTGAEGYFEKVRDEWEDRTGITFTMDSVGIADWYGAVMEQAATGSSKFDVLNGAVFGNPDYFESNYIADIEDWVNKYDPELRGERGVIEPVHLWGNNYMSEDEVRLIALGGDGDQMTPYIRSDWVDDPDHQEEYEAQYGEQLTRPETVDELDQQIKYFTENTPEGQYGAWIYLSPFFAKTTFSRRLLQYGTLWFDEDFRPQFNNEDGVQALKDLLELKPYLHPDAGSAGFGVPYTEFPGGNIYATFQWPSLAPVLMSDNSAITEDQWEMIPAPGRMHDGQMLNPVQHQGCLSYRVNANSEMPELAYLFIQWVHSPRVSENAIRSSGFIEPFRHSHFESQEIGEFMAGSDWEDYLETYNYNLLRTFPELTVKGVNQYNQAIDQACTNVLNNDKDPQDQLDQAAAKCEEITEEIGREKQKKQWNLLTAAYGAPLRDALDLPSPDDFDLPY